MHGKTTGPHEMDRLLDHPAEWSRLDREDAEGLVADVQRKCPMKQQSDLELLSLQPTRKHGKAVAPRLRAILERETQPKLTGVIMEAWGDQGLGLSEPSSASAAHYRPARRRALDVALNSGTARARRCSGSRRGVLPLRVRMTAGALPASCPPGRHPEAAVGRRTPRRLPAAPRPAMAESCPVAAAVPCSSAGRPSWGTGTGPAGPTEQRRP